MKKNLIVQLDIAIWIVYSTHMSSYKQDKKTVKESKGKSLYYLLYNPLIPE